MKKANDELQRLQVNQETLIQERIAEKEQEFQSTVALYQKREDLSTE